MNEESYRTKSETGLRFQNLCHFLCLFFLLKMPKLQNYGEGKPPLLKPCFPTPWHMPMAPDSSLWFIFKCLVHNHHVDASEEALRCSVDTLTHGAEFLQQEKWEQERFFYPSWQVFTSKTYSSHLYFFLFQTSILSPPFHWFPVI